MSKEILKEAIAEAKIIKETAIANAKIVLEEAFEPRMRSLLAKRLEEMEIEDEELEENNETINSNIEEIELDSNKTDFNEEELDLESILREIEDENINEAEEETETEETETGEEIVDDMEDMDLNIEEMSEEDLKTLIEDVISGMVASGELEPGENFEENDEDEDLDIEIEDDDDEDIEIEDEIEEVKDNTLPLKQELNEAYKAIKSLKKDLNDINVLNSKLLYLNKVLVNKTINESQKVKIVAAFEKAKTSKEAKLIYETITESLIMTKPKNHIKEHLSRASKPAGSAHNKPILDVNPMVERWQKLAGIK